jgi:hypothetical protein
MAARIYVAKYIRDPRRWEPRNIGIFVVDEHGLAGKFIGERADGSVDKRSVKGFVRNTEVYEEWVKYWRRTLMAGGIEEILESTTPHFWVAESGEVWIGDETPEKLVERYFSELVLKKEGEEDDRAAAQLRTAVERLLTETGVANSPAFARDETLESSGLTPPERFQFQYILQDGRTVVGQRVSLASEPYVHDALWKFSHLHDDIRRVAFVAESEEDASLHRSHLEQLSKIVDVGQPSAADLVRDAFLG